MSISSKSVAYNVGGLSGLVARPSRRSLVTTLLASVFTFNLFGVASSFAEDNVISSTVTTQNGGFNLNGGDSLTVTEDGGITTTVALTHAILATGNNNTIINQGSIPTAGTNAHGILLNSSDDNNVTQSGSIVTTNTAAHGIFFINSHDNSFIQSGSISTTGNDAYGMLTHLSDNNSFTQSGSIVTTGTDAYGKNISHSDDNTFTQSGSIVTTGIDAYGVYLVTSDSNTFNISGLIKSVQSNAMLFDNDSNNNIINLTTGAFLGGTIDLGTGGNFVNIATSPGHSVVWNFGAGSTITNGIQVSGAGAYLVDGNVFYSVDPTAFLGRADAVGDTAGMLTGLANSRLGSGDGSGARVWGDLIGGASQYGATNSTLGYNSHQVGLAVGAEQDFDIIASTFGVLGGYLGSASKAESQFITSQETDTHGGFAGIYGAHQVIDDITLSGSLIGGWMHNNSTRNFNNNTATPSFIETATGSYDSFFIVPGISLSKDYVIDDQTTITPMVSALYAHQWSRGYTETGSSNNLTVGSGQESVFEGKAELGVTHHIDAGEQHNGGHITARFGAMVRATPNNETPTLSFAGIGTLSTATNDRHTLVAATAG